MNSFNQVAELTSVQTMQVCPLCQNTGLAPVALGDWMQIAPGAWACGLCGHGEQRRQEGMDALAGKRMVALLNAAEIPAKFAGLTLESYLGAARKQKLSGPSKVAAAGLVRKWLQAAEPRWLYLHGPTGVGKTGLACAALQALLNRGTYSGRFVSTFDMLADMRKRFGEPNETNADVYADALAGVEVLVIDELHPVKVTEWTQQVLFSLLWRRDNGQKVTILTSTLGLGDAELHRAVTEAGVRRIKENALVVRIEGNPLGFGQ